MMKTIRRVTPTVGTFRRQLMLWVGGLSLVTLLSAGLYVGRIATQQTTAAGGESLHATATTAAQLLGSSLRERELEIHLLSQAPHFVRGDLDHPDVLQSLERRKTARTEYAWLGIADADGIVRQATGGMLRLQSVAQRPWFKAAIETVHIGDVHEAMLLAKLLPATADGAPQRFIDFAAPIRDASGRLRGVVGAHIHWNWVTETVQAALGPEKQRRGMEILIADRQGRILYPAHLVDVTRLPAAALTRSGYAVLRWDDARDYLTSRTAVSAGTQTDLGWQIVVRQPLDAALQPARALRNQLLVSGLLAVVLFGLLALHLATRISRPIEQLVDAARQVERRGHAPVYPESGQALEIDQLSQSMQSMTHSLLAHERELEAMNASLEQQVAERTEALTRANQALNDLATRDALTGVRNRRRFDEKLAEVFQLYRRSQRGYALLLIDADHFKQVNDTHGHLVGDEVLKQLARIIGDNVRCTDFVARYGGEEFVVLLPDTPDANAGQTVAEKIRRAVEATPFASIGKLTISLGLSVAMPTDATPEAILQRADSALYQAKEAGRNRVAFMPGTDG